jgi:hypothetical protein
LKMLSLKWKFPQTCRYSPSH